MIAALLAALNFRTLVTAKWILFCCSLTIGLVIDILRRSRTKTNEDYEMSGKPIYVELIFNLIRLIVPQDGIYLKIYRKVCSKVVKKYQF